MSGGAVLHLGAGDGAVGQLRYIRLESTAGIYLRRSEQGPIYVVYICTWAKSGSERQPVESFTSFRRKQSVNERNLKRKIGELRTETFAKAVHLITVIIRF